MAVQKIEPPLRYLLTHGRIVPIKEQKVLYYPIYSLLFRMGKSHRIRSTLLLDMVFIISIQSPLYIRICFFKGLVVS